jgi:carbamate kinase
MFKDGEIKGVEAVIDKDYASSLLAQEIGADLYIILTGVPQVSINFGKLNIKFIEAGGKEVLVTSASELGKALQRQGGTYIVR